MKLLDRVLGNSNDYNLEYLNELLARIAPKEKEIIVKQKRITAGQSRWVQRRLRLLPVMPAISFSLRKKINMMIFTMILRILMISKTTLILTMMSWKLI